MQLSIDRSWHTETGFTLIEMLTVIVIIGLLASIGLPAFLNQSAKARMSEAKTTIGTVNRAQQAYRLEHPSFATDFAQLRLGLPTATENYTYLVTGSIEAGTIVSRSGDLPLKNFSGGVFVVQKGLTRSISCQTIEVNAPAVVPVREAETCPADMESIR